MHTPESTFTQAARGWRTDSESLTERFKSLLLGRSGGVYSMPAGLKVCEDASLEELEEGFKFPRRP